MLRCLSVGQARSYVRASAPYATSHYVACASAAIALASLGRMLRLALAPRLLVGCYALCSKAAQRHYVAYYTSHYVAYGASASARSYGPAWCCPFDNGQPYATSHYVAYATSAGQPYA